MIWLVLLTCFPTLTWLLGGNIDYWVTGIFDQDGIQDDGEDGVSDVNITLYNSANDKIGTDTTDSSGKYEFCNLSSDDYYIVVDTTLHSRWV